MNEFDLNRLVRPNVLAMQPYSSARDEFEGEADIYLDANENPFRSNWNRYPDPRQGKLKQALAKRLGLEAKQIFLGNGSDEAIDLLFRAFCRPGLDRVLTCPPTYGMYKVSAAVNDVEVLQIRLTSQFQIDVEALEPHFEDERNKLLFLCSPNNPTGNLMAKEDVERILRGFPGLVLVDEAYVDFAPEGSCANWIDRFPNLVVLRTFSKAWGLAGLRLGAALASPALVAVLDRIKPPYNVNSLTQQLVLEALKENKVEEMVAKIRAERTRVAISLSEMPRVLEILPSDANFLLVRFENAGEVFRSLRERSIVVRDRCKQVPDGLRITIGTPAENSRLLHAIEQILQPDYSIH